MKNRTQYEAEFIADLSSHVNQLERFGKIAMKLNQQDLKDLPCQAEIIEQVEGLINAYQSLNGIDLYSASKPTQASKKYKDCLDLLGSYCMAYFMKSQNSNKKDEPSAVISHHKNERNLKRYEVEFKPQHKKVISPSIQRNPEALELLAQDPTDEQIVFTGATLQAIREGCEMTQDFLADGVGMSKNYLSAIERGVKPLTAKMNLKIIDFLTSNQAISMQVLQYALSKLPQPQKQGA
ncbi:helix-turn-helix domain-containing protein [Paenibacillus solisilvae]|uniref:Helix-turn-helix domain-containing protein n=1 Tax=Paenibacillus solisilvae TaxID=2486751 RepID=A0ABW0VUT3_9BACL